ncbi:MAG: hypothetical protein JRH11_21560, partial [Deltaproteobacteria bacterium]|nr:hypothetical protein [Deltaproteobacteria bacterium]
FVLDRVYQGLEGMLEGDDEEEDPFATARRNREADEADESRDSNDESDARAANETSTRAAQ